jgi:hypothetical protein
MIFKDVRCALTNWWLVTIGVLAYLIAVNAGAFGGSISWLYLLLIVHFSIGLFRIAQKNRPLGFGLNNLVAEMSFLVTIAFLSVLPVKILVSKSDWLCQQTGQTCREIYDSIPWMIVPLAFIIIPTSLLCMGTWVIATSYKNEPVME